MKQGRASRDVSESYKVEPKPRVVDLTAVSHLGNKIGSHITDQGDVLRKEYPLRKGPGYVTAGPPAQGCGPGGGRIVRKTGSQGRY